MGIQIFRQPPPLPTHPQVVNTAPSSVFSPPPHWFGLVVCENRGKKGNFTIKENFQVQKKKYLQNFAILVKLFKSPSCRWGRRRFRDLGRGWVLRDRWATQGEKVGVGGIMRKNPIIKFEFWRQPSPSPPPIQVVSAENLRY